MAEKQATFGAGCFWGVEETFRKIPGVINTSVGYMGGTKENPTYEEVCSNTTGHVEVVRVAYDDTKVRYDDLLQVFWQAHNPTEINRQGPDVGVQYRTVIFYHTEEQRAAAQASKDALAESGGYDKPIATVIEPVQDFYMAEDYHQQYLAKRGKDSCHI